MPTITGSSWFNSRPLKREELEDKVVLVDFWTYSCVNCLRTMPYLAKWWEKYRDKGLMILGVHTPEFEFEKDQANVAKAIRDLGIGWPVVQDNEYVNWNAFANRYWPAKYLVNRKGEIVYTHFGEGSYEETEMAIRDLLDEKGADKVPDEHAHGNVCFSPTPELYCGYSRGRLSNSAGYVRGEETLYEAPEELREDSIALSGRFVAQSEYVESRQEGAELLLRFRATEVNLVLEPARQDAVVEVRYEGKGVEASERGADLGEDGRVRVTEPRMYRLFRPGMLREGLLSIRALQGNFRAYAFTFSGCE